MSTFDPAPGSLPAGQRIYAIGDIHGCADQLVRLHGRIAADLKARPVPHPVLLHIGDYVDKGPNAAAVVARLSAMPRGKTLRVVNLMGNHEHTMQLALTGDRAAGTDWLVGGGQATLASYGVPADAARDAWTPAVPAAHRDWLGGLDLTYQAGDYVFAHAGIRPGVPLHRQDPEDLRGIRNAFLFSDADFGAIVVHGHTPRQAPEIRANRIGIDTGAALGGKLTCLVLEGRRLGFLQA